MDGSNYYVFLNALFSTYPSHLRKTLIYLNTILLKVIQWEDSKKSFKEVVSSFPFRIYVVVCSWLLIWIQIHSAAWYNLSASLGSSQVHYKLQQLVKNRKNWEKRNFCIIQSAKMNAFYISPWEVGSVGLFIKPLCPGRTITPLMFPQSEEYHTLMWSGAKHGIQRFYHSQLEHAG